MPVIERFGRNLQFLAYHRVIMVFTTLLLTPFILRHVDLGLYGLNALLISVVGYFYILDFGLSSGVSRFTAVFFGEGKPEKISDILRFSIKFFVGLGILVAASLFALSFFYERLFRIEADLIIKGRILLLIYAVSSLFIWAIIPFRGVLEGLQRMDLVSKIGIAISILNIPIAIMVLRYTGSYLLYVGLLQFITVIFSSACIIFVLKKIPNLVFNFSPISKELKDKLIRFSGWHFIAGIFAIIIFQIDNFIIGIILGVKAIAIYTIAFLIHTYIRSLNSLIGGPLYSVITAEFTRRNVNSRNSMIINATRMHTGVLIPIAIIVLISSDNFILAWVGERFSGSILPCKILLSYWFFNITTEILSLGVVGGKGKVIESVRINAFVAIANLGLSLLLIRFIGITGVALGTAIPWILASNFYIYRYCKILSISVPEFIRKAIVPNLPHFLLTLILSLIAQQFMKTQNVFQVIAIMAIIYGITQIVGYNLLPPENKNIVKKIIALRI